MKSTNRMVCGSIFVAVACFAAAGISGCIVGSGNGPLAHVGAMQTESISVPMSAVKSVHAHLQMSAGEMDVSGGSSQLLDGKITYNVPEWKPDMSYNINNDQGSLMLMQPEAHHTTFGGVKYIWDLHFANKMPLELAVEMGAGDSKLNLAELNLRNLDVQVGAGESTIDLTGDWKQDVSATIQGGVGEVHVRLPRSMGVRVTVEGGLGSVSAPDFKHDGDDYENDAYGKGKPTLEVHITGGIGQVYLELGAPHGIV